MNIKGKKLLIVFLMVAMAVVIAPNKSNAGLQANKGGTSLTNTTASQFFDGIRKMETKYGTLGKEAVLNDKYLDTTNNGIDVHMVLNTEWGTVALLTDSIFGVGKGISGTNNNSTSTGNESGVYGLASGEQEYVSTIYKGSSDNEEKIVQSDSRYSNDYRDIKLRLGDALECKKWFGAMLYQESSNSYPVLKRGSGELFSFYSSGGSDSSRSTRAVVVCGENL